MSTGRLIVIVLLVIIVIAALGVDVNLWFTNGLEFLKAVILKER